MLFILAQTENIIAKTEHNLAVLEDVIEEAELQKRMREYDQKAEMLREIKLADLEQLKSMLTFKSRFIIL